MNVDPTALESSFSIRAAPLDNPLVQHAQRELSRAGLFDSDADYDGALGIQVLELIRAFAGRGHSGESANRVLELFGKLARFQPLTPLTSDPEEWSDVSEASGMLMWQNKRDSRFLSRDGGQTSWMVGSTEPPNDDSLRTVLAQLLNQRSRENESNTPDFVLAQFLEACLKAFEEAVNAREQWQGGGPDNP